jgi:hypothetical protein
VGDQDQMKLFEEASSALFERLRVGLASHGKDVVQRQSGGAFLLGSVNLPCPDNTWVTISPKRTMGYRKMWFTGNLSLTVRSNYGRTRTWSPARDVSGAVFLLLDHFSGYEKFLKDAEVRKRAETAKQTMLRVYRDVLASAGPPPRGVTAKALSSGVEVRATLKGERDLRTVLKLLETLELAEDT